MPEARVARTRERSTSFLPSIIQSCQGSRARGLNSALQYVCTQDPKVARQLYIGAILYVPARIDRLAFTRTRFSRVAGNAGHDDGGTL